MQRSLFASGYAIVIGGALATLVIAEPSHASAGFIPEFPLGSCGTGPGAPGCIWSCNASEDQNPRCSCKGGTDDGKSCRPDDASVCADGSCPSCILDVTDAFIARLVLRIDDAPCTVPGDGSVVTIGLSGKTADGAEFSVTSKQFDFCGGEAGCDTACDSKCDRCEPDVCEVPPDTSCPPTIGLLCDFQGDRINEEDIGESRTWFGAHQPAFDFMIDELTGPNGPFPTATGRPVVLSIDFNASEVTDHSQDEEPSELRACVKMGILRDVKPVSVPPAVAEAEPVTSSLAVDDLDACADIELCGDSVLDPGEECDGSSDNACPGACTAECKCPGVDVTCSLDRNALRAPNHKLRNVGLLTTTDCSGSCPVSVQVFGDEDDQEPTGDGNFSPDASLAGGVLRLRAERKGNADGRVYLVITTATDSAQNSGHDCCAVVVPRSESPRDRAAVEAQAAAAEQLCATTGNAPPGYFKIGDGPTR